MLQQQRWHDIASRRTEADAAEPEEAIGPYKTSKTEAERVVEAIREHYGKRVLKTIRDDVAGIATADVLCVGQVACDSERGQDAIAAGVSTTLPATMTSRQAGSEAANTRPSSRWDGGRPTRAGARVSTTSASMAPSAIAARASPWQAVRVSRMAMAS